MRTTVVLRLSRAPRVSHQFNDHGQAEGPRKADVCHFPGSVLVLALVQSANKIELLRTVGKGDGTALDVAYRSRLKEFRSQREGCRVHASKAASRQDLVVDSARSLDFLGR